MTRDQKEDLLRRQRETREDDALTEEARRLLERLKGNRT